MKLTGEIHLPGNSLWRPLTMWLGGSQSRSGHFGQDQRLLCLLEIEPQFFRHPAHSQSLSSM